MKRILLSILTVLLLVSCVTTPEPAPSSQYQKVVEHGRGKDIAFDLTMRFLNEKFVSAKNVIQHADKESGLITGVAYKHIRSVANYSYGINYSFTAELKDNKTRFTFDLRFGANDALKVNYDAFVGDTEVLLDQYGEFVARTKTDW